MFTLYYQFNMYLLFCFGKDSRFLHRPLKKIKCQYKVQIGLLENVNNWLQKCDRRNKKGSSISTRFSKWIQIKKNCFPDLNWCLPLVFQGCKLPLLVTCFNSTEKVCPKSVCSKLVEFRNSTARWLTRPWLCCSQRATYNSGDDVVDRTWLNLRVFK